MAVITRIAGYAAEMTERRRHLHRHPEPALACHETAEFVADRLCAFGTTEIEQGIAESGLVAIIDGQGGRPTIGLRADIDALPITEATGAAWQSTRPGLMHACSHDGHTTMLLGAVRHWPPRPRARPPGRRMPDT